MGRPRGAGGVGGYECWEGGVGGGGAGAPGHGEPPPGSPPPGPPPRGGGIGPRTTPLPCMVRGPTPNPTP